jgi:hypothetical protein
MRHTNQNLKILICSFIIAAGPVRGDVRLHVSGGLPVVESVYVNSHGPYRFLVDTGTNVNFIDVNLARSIGLRATFQTKLTSSMGATSVSGSDGVEVFLGSAKADAQRFLFLPPDTLQERLPGIRGVLGQWFLYRFDYTLDMRAKRMEFGEQNPNGTRAKFEMVNGEPVVSTSLGNLILDSGASQLVLFGVRRGGENGLRGDLRTVTGSQEVGLVTGRPLIIEGRKISRGAAVAIPNRTPGVDGLLPIGLFKVIYICNSQGYLVFE